MLYHFLLLALSVFGFSHDTWAMNMTRTPWRAELYENAFFGARFADLRGPLVEEIRVAQEMRREALDQKTSWAQRIAYDWIYTLTKLNETLLRKSFLEWTVEDLQTIAGWLSRLIDKHAGTFRTFEEHRILRALKEEEKRLFFPKFEKFLNEFYADPSLYSHAEVDSPGLPIPAFSELYPLYPPGVACLHTDPIHIRESLVQSLHKAQAAFRHHDAEWGTQREEIFMRIAAELAYDIIRHRPFKRANTRLGLILMYVICKQSGVMPILIPDRACYLKIQVEALQKDSAEPIYAYWMDLLAHSSKEQLFDELDTQGVCVYETRTHEKSPSLIPGNWDVSPQGEACHEGVGREDSPEGSSVSTTEEVSEDECGAEEAAEPHVIDTLMRLLKKSGAQGPVAAISIPKPQHLHQVLKVRQCSGCKRLENGRALLRCSVCKITCYCNAVCQKKDWPAHKKICKK